MRIDICGNIASGKTTLANLFKEEANVLLEEFQTNPFWASFYSNPQKFKFETEIAFILQHYHLIKRDYEEGKVNVCDFSFLLDYSYALSDLNNRELEIFKDIYNKILDEIGPPNILISLRCGIDPIVKRINERGRKEEKNIDINFLKLIEANIEKNTQTNYSAYKLLEIDSELNNFAHDEEAKNKIMQEIFSQIKTIH